MSFAAALATDSDTSAAIQKVCQQALQDLKGGPQLALVFFSPHHADRVDRILAGLEAHLPGVPLLGCNGESIVGNDQEIEETPAVSLWLARWSTAPGLESFQLEVTATPDGPSILGWPDGLASADPEQAVLLLLADPFTFPIDLCLQRLNTDYPGLRVLGGMASGGQGKGDSRLLLGPRLLRSGAVGVLLPRVAVRSVVSQGCRPVGRHMVITRAQENVLVELGGRTPLAQLQQLWQEL
ncbi:MAG TPA: FIST N-terminal domain-containing protein, partial [Gemmataceae bacterium]|nr:FIST N-terminal domain-containing protein [Gemmataceae bacterium]